MAAQHHDVVIVGGGLAGIVTALEALRAGQSVALVDRDAPERLGGLALWAFGGMALVGTALQARMKIPDSPEAALRDWVRFGEMDPADTYPQQWARYYVEHSRAEVYDWLLGEGVKFMPAVNWIERGRHGEGNSVPRYHIIWGTARELTRRMIAAMRQFSRCQVQGFSCAATCWHSQWVSKPVTSGSGPMRSPRWLSHSADLHGMVDRPCPSKCGKGCGKPAA